MQEDVAAITLGERDKQPSKRRVVLHIVAMRVYNPDDFQKTFADLAKLLP